MTFTDTDHLFITRAEVRTLIGLLKRIPALAEDLAITEARQGRVSRPGLTAPRRPAKLGPKLPVHLGAYAAAENLRQHLLGWVRIVCEQRGLPFGQTVGEPTAWVSLYWPPGTFVGPVRPGRPSPQGAPEPSLVELARWLDRNVIALAMTEGAETALDEIRAAVRECDRQIDLPPDDEICIDPERLQAANRMPLTAYQIEKFARDLGEVGKGLTRDRVRTLRKHGGLRECSRDGDTAFYRLGDVLEAHLRHATRQRKAGGKEKAA